MTTAIPARRAARQGLIADFNQTVILDAVRRSTDGVSRVELAAATGLSKKALYDAAVSGKPAVARQPSG